MTRDIAASVRARLLALSKSTNRPFQEVLQYYAMERFLFRICQSPFASRFVLKGALMFTAWGTQNSRATRDIDLLARSENSVDAMKAVFEAVCLERVSEDGIQFLPDTVQGIAIKEDADYPGVRVTFSAILQSARVAMQIDIGFGDVINPKPEMTTYPTLLEFEPPRLWGYPRETVVAEKFEAMTKLGQLNSRMKDFYDIALLSNRFDFDGAVLAHAISQTFVNRKTEIQAQPHALTLEFAKDPIKQAQWAGFLRKSKLKDLPQSLDEVVGQISEFLVPIATSICRGESFDKFWPISGSWRTLEQ